MEPADYDGAWKEAAEKYLRPLLTRCFPEVARELDWSQGWKFLDQELQAITPDAKLRRQRVDKLIEVRRLDGVREWLLLHLELQHQKDPRLPLRMYQYQHRLTDRYKRPVVGLAILGDLNPGWRPNLFEFKLWGCELRYQFMVCKLLDFENEPGALEQNPDPAGVIISAHLAAQRTTGNLPERQRLKWQLTRRLHEQGYSKADILELFRLLDWLLRLSAETEVEFLRDLREYEEQKRMPYITSVERIGLEKGRQEGRQEGRQAALHENILDILEARFGAVPYSWREQLQTVDDESELKRLLRQAAVVPALAGFQSCFLPSGKVAKRPTAKPATRRVAK